MTNDEKGLGAYQGGNARRGPRQVMDAYLRKCALRAELARCSAEVEAGVEALTASELEDLKAMMAVEVEAVDADAQALRAQVEAEAKLAETTVPLTVPVSRRAASALASEARRRLSRGVFPSSAALVAEAVVQAYGTRYEALQE